MARDLAALRQDRRAARRRPQAAASRVGAPCAADRRAGAQADPDSADAAASRSSGLDGDSPFTSATTGPANSIGAAVLRPAAIAAADAGAATLSERRPATLDCSPVVRSPPGPAN